MWTSIPQSETAMAKTVLRPGAVLDMLQRRRKLVGFLLLNTVFLMFILLLTSHAPPPPLPVLTLDANDKDSTVPSSTPKPIIIEDCPASHYFQTPQFQSQCQAWVQAITNWTPGDNSGFATYACRDETQCHGLGDRLAGMQGALTYAMENNMHFKAEFPGFASLFTPPKCLFTGAKDWSTNLPSKSRKLECVATYSHTCSMRQCTAQTVLFENSDKACLPSTFCDSIVPVNTAQLYGCGLRAMMEPTDKFFNHQIPFHGSSGEQTITVAEAEQIMSKYFVIGIHFRIGDFALLRTKEFSKEEHRFLVPFQCASTVQSFLEQRSNQVSGKPEEIVNSAEALRYVKQDSAEFTVNGKEVRWFLASDSQSVRDIALDLFGDKLLMITNKPLHIAFAKKRAEDPLADTLAEWYLLGKSDLMIANRIGGTSLFRGRLSSFSKTTWSYQNKHEFYDAGACVKRNFLLDGTWRVAPPPCKQGVKTVVNFANQPHLSPLAERKLSFPEAWVNEGKVLVMEGKRSEDGEGTGL